MLTPTHLVTGQAAYFTACIFAGHSPVVVESAIALSASLIPDLDHRQGYVGRLFPWLSGPLEHHFGHRTATHSLIVQAAAGLLAWLFLPTGFALALISGWVSHSLSDMVTPSGVAWFWPWRARCVIPGDSKYRIEAMSWAELGFLGITALISIFLFSIARSEAGSAGVITSALGRIESARSQYDAEKGRNAWTLRVKGRDNATFEDVAGEYPVIGDWGEAGFMLKADARTVTACRSSACDWYADHAVLMKGKPENTTTTTLKIDQISRDSLLETLRRLQSAGKVLVLGSMRARGAREQLPAVKVSGEVVTFSYAGVEALEGLPAQLREVNLVAQVRHEPGSTVPDVALTGESRGMDPLLERWVR